ncbi:hypothetical protein GJ496_004837 [Pomphorhynchus laevis]|nr:hypothetical protein GJ496_004837 [Pomphorhynchus laevis]
MPLDSFVEVFRVNNFSQECDLDSDKIFFDIGKSNNPLKLSSEKLKIKNIKEIIKDLPPPNFRTLRYLMLHLSRMANFNTQTNMNARNLAIVWAPNLLKSPCQNINISNNEANENELKFVQIVAYIAEHLILNSKDIFDCSPVFDSIHTASTSEGSESSRIPYKCHKMPYHFPPKSSPTIPSRVSMNCSSIPNVITFDNMIMNCDRLVNYNSSNDYLNQPTRIDPPILNEQLEQASSMDNDEFSSDDCEEDDDNRTSTFKASSILLESNDNSTYSLAQPFVEKVNSSFDNIDQFIDAEFANLDILVEENQIYFNPPSLLSSIVCNQAKFSDQHSCVQLPTLNSACRYDERLTMQIDDTEMHRSLINLPSITLGRICGRNEGCGDGDCGDTANNTEEKQKEERSKKAIADCNSKLKEKLSSLARRYSSELQDNEFFNCDNDVPVLSQSVSTFTLDYHPARPCTVKERVKWLENNTGHFVVEDESRCTFKRGEVNRTSVRELLSRFEHNNNKLNKRNQSPRMITP